MGEKLEEKDRVIEEARRQGSNRAARGMFEEYEPSGGEVETDGKVAYEEELKNMEANYEDRISSLKKEYEELSKVWDGEERKDEIERLKREGKDEMEEMKRQFEEERFQMKKWCDEEVMERENKLNEMEGKLAGKKEQLSAKDASMERLRRELKELEARMSKELKDRDAGMKEVQGRLKEQKLLCEGLQERLQQRGRESEEVVQDLKRQLRRVEEDGVSGTNMRLEELDNDLSAKDDEIRRLKHNTRELENEKLTLMAASKQAKDDLRQALSSLKLQHDEELRHLRRQLKAQEPVVERKVSSCHVGTQSSLPGEASSAKSDLDDLRNVYELRLSDLSRKADKDKERLKEGMEDEVRRLRSEHAMEVASLRREGDEKQLRSEIAIKKEAAEALEDMRNRHQERLNEVSLASNKQLNNNLRDFSEQVAELKRSFGKMDRAKEEELREVKKEKGALKAEVEALRREANDKPAPETLVVGGELWLL